MPGELQVRQKLRLVDWQQNLNSLEFHNYLLFDDNIQSETGIEPDRIVNHRQADLSLNLQSAFHQFVSETNLVYALQQARSERLVNRVRSIHHHLRNLIGSR